MKIKEGRDDMCNPDLLTSSQPSCNTLFVVIMSDLCTHDVLSTKLVNRNTHPSLVNTSVFPSELCMCMLLESCALYGVMYVQLGMCIY